MTEKNKLDDTEALATNYLKNKRGFSDKMVQSVIDNPDVLPTADGLVVTMRKLNGEETGKLTRYYDPQPNSEGKILKSKTHAGTKVGCFLPPNVDLAGSAIAITEGELDNWILSYCYSGYTIGLQGIQMLPKLIIALQQAGVEKIYLFVDSNKGADDVIGKLFGNENIDISTIYDSRYFLVDANEEAGEGKEIEDLNDYYREYGDIDVQEVMSKSPTIYELRKKNDYSYKTIAEMYPSVLAKNIEPAGFSGYVMMVSGKFNAQFYPIVKEVIFDDHGYPAKTEYEFLVIGGFHKNKQRLKIDSGWFVDLKLFEKELQKLIGIEIKEKEDKPSDKK